MDDTQIMEKNESSARSSGHFSEQNLDLDFAALRREVDELTSAWGAILKAGAARTAATAASTVKENPWTSVAVAAAIGMAIAIIVIPRRENGTMREQRSMAWHPTAIAPNRLASNPTATAPTAAAAPENLFGRFSRMLESISNMDSSSLPAIPGSIARWLKLALPDLNKPGN